MPDVEAQQSKGISPAPQPLRPIFSPWLTILAMAIQATLCGLAWGLVGRTAVKILPLPDNVASFVNNHPSNTNMAITTISTVLGIIGSTLLGITVEHALLSRLPRGVPFSVMAPWLQIARNSLYLRPRRYLWWTLLSASWVIVVHFLTTAWSNLLTPVVIVQPFETVGQELDFLSPALSAYLADNLGVQLIPPGTRNSSITPDSLAYLANITGYLSQAGRSAASAFIDSGYPAFVGQFNTSTGGVNPIPPQEQLTSFPTLPVGYRGLSTSYTLTQQGYTANVSCRQSSSPTISLNNSASEERTYHKPSGPFNYTLETWSWSTNCSGNGDYYTGEVDLLMGDNGPIGNGLFATSVCFYQDFSGPSNQSFLVLMQSPNTSGYDLSYFVTNPSLPIVCQVTPMVTTLEVQYGQNSLVRINNILDRTLPPEYTWPLASLQGSEIWAAYVFAQGLYSNAFADDPIEAVYLLATQLPDGGVMPILEQYVRGVFEYLASVIRGSFASHLQVLPSNMTTTINGTMNVQTVGWRLNPPTHSIAIIAIMFVTIMTAVSGIFALLEASAQETLRNTLLGGGIHRFNPTNLTDMLLASSMGSLSNTLSESRDIGAREKLTIRLEVTDGGQPVLNTHADVAHRAGGA